MYKDFYKTGITEIDFKSKELDSVLLDIFNGKLKDDFDLISKYNKTWDLRPDVISYSDIFLKVLKDNKIKDLIKDITLKDMSLFHVQVRIVKDENSYMSWHRDTYYKHDGTLIGQAPHAIKIIYYPDFENKSFKRLSYLIGSNRIVFPNNQYDNQLFSILESKDIHASNSKAVLFDVNGLHSVVPEQQGERSIRVIYSFLNKKQIIDEHSSNDLHIKTMKAYEGI